MWNWGLGSENGAGTRGWGLELRLGLALGLGSETGGWDLELGAGI